MKYSISLTFLLAFSMSMQGASGQPGHEQDYFAQLFSQTFSGAVGGNGGEGMNNAVCSLPVDSGPCRASIEMYYFDFQAQKCDTFTYGGCRGNPNKFKTYGDCYKKCIRKWNYQIIWNGNTITDNMITRK